MTPVVRALLFANVAAFLLQMVVPGLEDTLAFVPELALVQPWTVVTYMFMHADPMHLVFNMIGLFFFGPRVEQRLLSRRFATMFFVAGVTSAAVSAILSPGAAIIGASGGVFGVMLAFAWFWPDQPILIWGIFPVPARLLVIITTIFALWGGVGAVNDGIAHFGHLGGYLGAFLYLAWLDRKRSEFRRRVNAPAPEAVQRVAGYRAIDLSRVHEVNRDEVNRILDKINTTGLGSLTAQETNFLSSFVPPDDPAPTDT